MGGLALIGLILGGIYFLAQSGAIPALTVALAPITGALSSLTSPKLYALTEADATAIQQNYENGRTSGGNGNFVVDGVSFAAWMHAAILTLRITVYTKDTYCGGVARPAGSTVLAAGLAGVGFGLAAAEQIGNSASTLATGIVGTLGSLSSALPIVGTIIGVFTGVMSFMAAHHAAAVKLENQILCPLIPALNQALANAEAAMRSGQANGAQTKSTLDAIVNETEQVISQDASSGALQAIGEQVRAVRDGFYTIVQNSGI
jgi:hypothetical protein